jgi:signal transduction histidine kinase
MQMLHIRRRLATASREDASWVWRNPLWAGPHVWHARAMRGEEEMDMTQKKDAGSRRSADATKRNVERMEHLTDLLHRLDSLRDQERMHLSHELHDTLVSTLSAAKLECDWLLRAQPVSDAEHQRRLSRVSVSLAEAIKFTRQVIDQLWSAAVQHLGLVAAIQGQLADLRARWGVEVLPDVQGDMDTLPEVHALTLYRAVQTALKLAAEDGSPQRIHLSLRRSNRGIELQLALPSTATPRDSPLSLLDSALMRERVLRLRGEYLVADDGGGTVHLRLFLPLPPRGAGMARAAR